MKKSVVNIESVSNNSFGTGFVIDSNSKGVYILTCQHVLDDVETPVVENVLAKVIAKGEFIDMAVLYVSKLDLTPLALQTFECPKLDVEVIGFSVFNKTLTQKKHIDATLYTKSIELHSKEDDEFYTVRKIKANDGFNFERGNSGSPVICKSSGAVIAMISNKEGSELAYAIDINNLQTIWKDVPQELLGTGKKVEQSTPTKKEKIEQISGEKNTIVTKDNSKISKYKALKYILYFTILILLLFTVFKLLSALTPEKEDKHSIDIKDEKIQVKETIEKVLPPRSANHTPPKEIKAIKQEQREIKQINVNETLPSDPRKAIEYLKNTKKITIKKALKIAELYNSLPNEDSNAIHWYKKAEQLGYIKAKYPLAILYCKQGNFSKFIQSKDILDYANSSRKEFKYDIGLCYNEMGDILKARKWLEASSLMGYQPAKEALFTILTGELGYNSKKARSMIKTLKPKGSK